MPAAPQINHLPDLLQVVGVILILCAIAAAGVAARRPSARRVVTAVAAFAVGMGSFTVAPATDRVVRADAEGLLPATNGTVWAATAAAWEDASRVRLVGGGTDPDGEPVNEDFLVADRAADRCDAVQEGTWAVLFATYAGLNDLSRCDWPAAAAASLNLGPADPDGWHPATMNLEGRQHAALIATVGAASASGMTHNEWVAQRELTMADFQPLRNEMDVWVRFNPDSGVLDQVRAASVTGSPFDMVWELVFDH